MAAQVFVAIHEQGSMAAAADTLGMSRPMVTRYLAQMEDWAGARLLHRSTRSVGLTPAGADTLSRCRRLIEAAESVPTAADADLDEPRGLLRIACSQSLGQSVLVQAVSGYLERFPRTSVELQISNQSVDLVRARVDLAVRITDRLPPTVIGRSFGQCESVVVAAPAYIRAHGAPESLEALGTHNCLAYAHFGHTQWDFTQGEQTFGVRVSGNLSADDPGVLMQAALAGAGVALQPLYAAAPRLASGELVALLPQYRPHALGVYAVYASRRRMTATLRTMLDFLTNWFEDKRPCDMRATMPCMSLETRPTASGVKQCPPWHHAALARSMDATTTVY